MYANWDLIKRWPEDGKANQSKHSRTQRPTNDRGYRRRALRTVHGALNARSCRSLARGRWPTCRRHAPLRIARCSNRQSRILTGAWLHWKAPSSKIQFPNSNSPNTISSLPFGALNLDLELGTWSLELGIYSRLRSSPRGTLRRSRPLRRSVNCSRMKPSPTSSRSISDSRCAQVTPSRNSCVACVLPGP